MKKLLPALLLITLMAGCDKDNDENESLFYGLWKTSYNDTIVFARHSGKNVISYDATLSPSFTDPTLHEYRYRDGKFFVNRSPGEPLFSQMTTFKWLDHGKSFQIQGLQWFAFISSTQTVFTFTRIL